MKTPAIPLPSRLTGALLGACIADALAMPVHWYYDTAALDRDYGRVQDYVRLRIPRHPASDSTRRRPRIPRDPGRLFQ